MGNKEFNNQSKAFLKAHTVRDYIIEKPMIKEFKEGSLIKTFFPSKKTDEQKRLDDDYRVPL